jgi:diguanylate cyclase
MTQRLDELKHLATRIQEDGQARAGDLAREIQRAQERLQQAETLAETDVLTGLGNRRYFERRIAAEINAQKPFCLAVMDLDGFKGVNDSFGHGKGDQLLKSIATSLAASVRDSDCIGRWGGDEFVILLRGIHLPEAEVRISEIQRRSLGRFMFGNQCLEISACFGMAEHQAGETADEVFDRADRNLYQMKKATKWSGDRKKLTSSALILSGHVAG